MLQDLFQLFVTLLFQSNIALLSLLEFLTNNNYFIMKIVVLTLVTEDFVA